MAQYFPDFSRSAALGFEQGRSMGEGQNLLGTFIKTMLADWQKRREVEYEIKGKEGLEVFKSRLEQGTPLYKAQTKAYETLGTQRTEGLIDEQIKKEAWEKYQKGDKSPEVLKTLGKWVSPMEVMFAQSMGFGGIDNTNIPTGKPPKYNPKTQKLQYNQKTNEWRIVPK